VKQWSTLLLAAIVPPSPPTSATVSIPARWAASSPRSTLRHSPSADTPNAMSTGLPSIESWQLKTSSSPCRSATPSTVAISLTSDSAGSARFPTMTGWTNSTEMCCASVAEVPMPKTSSVPPREKRSAMSWQARATRSASAASRRTGSSRSANAPVTTASRACGLVRISAASSIPVATVPLLVSVAEGAKREPNFGPSTR
jgi:hypothetical protein